MELRHFYNKSSIFTQSFFGSSDNMSDDLEQINQHD